MSSAVARIAPPLLTLAVLGVDTAVCAPWSGALATAAMIGGCTWLWSITRIRLAAHPGRSQRIRARIWWTLFLAAGGLALARGYFAFQQLTTVGGVELLGSQAVRTWIGLYVALFGGLTAFWLAPRRLVDAVAFSARRPVLLLACSFLALIGVGTLLLTLPVAVRDVQNISLLDALFTATSAVCVTGLTVNEPVDTYTAFGQAVILGCIQLGGIGVMSVAGLVTLSRRDASVKDGSAYASMMHVDTLGELRSLLRSVVFGTFFIEAVGAVLLWWLWHDDPRFEGRSVVWMAVFHAVSAFCNAGFSLLRGSLTTLAPDAGAQAVLMGLIVLGGLGFLVIREVVRSGAARAARALGRKSTRAVRLSLSARVVLASSAVLIVCGATVLALLESTNVLLLPGVDGLMNALFMSVSTRTAGFNTVAVGEFRDATLLCICLLMFIGGSPGSTAGGIKTTTAAALFATIRAELSGREAQMFGRALLPQTIRRATAIAAISCGAVLSVTLLLTLTEAQPLLPLLFEATSAFATTGLSTGITADLSVAGKLIIAVTMFVGRVGPFTVAVAVSDVPQQQPYRLARESMPIG